MVFTVGRIALCKIQMLRDKCNSADYPVENEEDEMKRKAISILVTGLVMASFAGCGTQAETANSVVSGQSLNETVAVDGEQIAAINETDKNSYTVDEGSTVDSNEYIVFYENRGESVGEVDLDSLVILEPAVPRELTGDTDVYYPDGSLAGYVKAGTTIDFTLMGTEWIGFSSGESDILLMRVEDAEKNIEYEDESQNTSELMEDVTDGNIVLYGGEKKPIKYGGIDEGIGEEINVVLTNVEADIPLYSGEGRLCGYLKEGGSIVVTEHCTVMTAWYRFPNPIEGTEYDYLYLHRYETVMSSDEKESIEQILQEADYLERTELLDAPEADMECYEFSIAREDYSDVGYMLNKYGLLEYDMSLNRLVHNTFYVECTRNGDYFDCKVYYK